MSARQCTLEKKSGLWGPVIRVRIGTGLLATVTVPVEDIAALELIGEKTKIVSRGTSRTNAALAGALVLGPAGLLAGSLIGGKDKFREGTGTLNAVLRMRDGRSYALDCTLQQAQDISAAIVSPSVHAQKEEANRAEQQQRDARAAESIAAHFRQAAMRKRATDGKC